MRTQSARFVTLVIITLCLSAWLALAAQPTREEADRLFAEKSFALAAEQYAALMKDAPEGETKRELRYQLGLSYANNHNMSAARKQFEALTTGTEDVWAGRAHWQLEPSLAMGQYQPPTSAPLEHLRQADRILSEAKPKDLFDFYLAVLQRALGRVPADKKHAGDRAYLYGFFDRIASLPMHAETTADLALMRAQRVGYVNATDDPEEMWRRIEGVVAEFPKSNAARRALMLLANHHKDNSELVEALMYYRRVTDEFPKSEEAKQAQELIDQIVKPEILFALNGSYLPDEPISFQLEARNLSKVQLSIIPFDLEKLMRKQAERKLDLAEVSGTPIETRSVQFEPRKDYIGTSESVTLRVEKAGAYVLRADGKHVKQDALLLVSDLALVTHPAMQRLEFWAVDSNTGVPRRDTEITIAHTYKSIDRGVNRPISRFQKFSEVRTNESGFADFTTDTNGTYLAVARSGDNVALSEGGHWWHSGNTTEKKGFVYTDRPVYRPGQKVYWRAIVRVGDETGLVIPKETYEVLIRDSRSQELFTSSGMTLSEFGSLSGELTLGAQPPLGVYNISIMAPNRYWQSTASFRVEEYKKPEYEVTVSSDKSLVKLGSELQARIDAKYYFGAPVADAEVKYTVRRRPHYFPWWRMMNSLAEMDLGWFEQTEAEHGMRHGSAGDIVSEGVGRTDTDGGFKFSFKAEAAADEPNNEPYWPGMHQGRFGFFSPMPNPVKAYDFQVEATVTDKSRRNIDGSKVIIVSERALKITGAAKHSIYTPGDVVTADLRSMNYNDEPAATSATVYVEKVKWLGEKLGDQITTLTTQRVDIPASGSLEFTWKAPANESGMMRFLVMVDDPFGGKSFAYAPFTVADENTPELFYRYQGVELILDREIYRVGETARVMILSEFPNAEAWFWIDAGANSAEKQVRKLTSRTTFLDIPITTAFVPNVEVHVVVVRDKKIYSSEKSMVVPPTRQVATVSLEMDKPEYRPGDTAAIALTALDWEGKPLRGEFSLSMFDTSLLYIAADTREDIRRRFYGQRRQIYSQVLTSMNTPVQYNPQRTTPWNFWSLGEASVSRFYARDGTVSQGDVYRVKSGGGRMEFAARSLAVAPATQESSLFSYADSSEAKAADKLSPPPPDAPVTVRSDFRDSMFWSPAILTGEDGKASVIVTFPDSLTTWQADAIGVGEGSVVGETKLRRTVTKNLLARLQAPRFFRERDEVVVSGVVHNYLDSTKSVRVSLDVSGLEMAETSASLQSTVEITAGGEKRVDWRMKVTTPGEAKLVLKALTDEESDAMEMSFLVLPHGIDKFVAWTGSSDDAGTSAVNVARDNDRVEIERMITIPVERIKATSKLTVIINPSLASVVRQALPYMIDYPYGCVEQTLNRFVPAVVAASAFRKLGMPADVTLDARIDDVTKTGLARLSDFQNSDGSWGWWKDEPANPYMTALTMHGLTLARDAGLDVDNAMFQRGLEALRQQVRDYKEKDQPGWYWRQNALNTLALQQLVLAMNGSPNSEAEQELWTRRDKLSPQSLAMLARSLKRSGRVDDAAVVMRNLHNFAVVVPENDTVHWGDERRGWYWWDDAVEATAQGLLAYLEVAPDDPMAPRAMKWLALNRESSWSVDRAVPRWKSTKDTAQSVLALTQYMLTKNERAADADFEVVVGDMPPRKFHLDADNYWKFDGTFTLEGDAVPEGDVKVRIIRKGTGTFFHSIFAEYFTLEEGITAAGNEIFVERKYEKLVRKDSSTTGVVAEDTYVPIADGATVVSGDELRVTLRIKSLNDYEYLVFEDAKPAGMEPVALQSGSVYAGFCSNMELRDQMVSFFVTHMPQGEHEITYNCRAEIPGVFHTMPTKGYAMYSPSLRANSSELVVRVVDPPEAD